jgi:transposase
MDTVIVFIFFCPTVQKNIVKVQASSPRPTKQMPALWLKRGWNANCEFGSLSVLFCLNLKQLTGERNALACNRTDASSQLHACSHQGKPDRDSIARTKKHVSFLDRQIKQIESEISSFVNPDKVLKNRMHCLLSIPGAGPVTAAATVAETDGFITSTGIKRATGYAGLDVCIQESGKWKGKSKISKRGNSHIRKALYMPALSKTVHDRETERHYERLKEKKGIGMPAVVAEERKLPGLLFSVFFSSKSIFLIFSD